MPITSPSASPLAVGILSFSAISEIVFVASDSIALPATFCATSPATNPTKTLITPPITVADAATVIAESTAIAEYIAASLIMPLQAFCDLSLALRPAFTSGLLMIPSPGVKSFDKFIRPFSTPIEAFSGCESRADVKRLSLSRGICSVSGVATVSISSLVKLVPSIPSALALDAGDNTPSITGATT